MVPLVPVSLFGAPAGATPVFTGAAASLGNAAAGSIVSAGNPAPAASVSAAPFTDLLTEAVGQVEQLEAQARSSVEGLMSGKGVDVHEAMIATEKAEMGFELVLSVRNKALSAYQQVIGMQF